ncbi:unnamed protein product, partial [Amoebophrya sp. A25]|eukprot:GSA25T00001047001.1
MAAVMALLTGWTMQVQQRFRRKGGDLLQILVCLLLWWGLAVYIISESKILMSLSTSAAAAATTPLVSLDTVGGIASKSTEEEELLRGGSTSSTPVDRVIETHQFPEITLSPNMDEATDIIREHHHAGTRSASTLLVGAFPFPLFISAWSNLVITISCLFVYYMWQRHAREDASSPFARGRSGESRSFHDQGGHPMVPRRGEEDFGFGNERSRTQQATETKEGALYEQPPGTEILSDSDSCISKDAHTSSTEPQTQTGEEGSSSFPTRSYAGAHGNDQNEEKQSLVLGMTAAEEPKAALTHIDFYVESVSMRAAVYRFVMAKTPQFRYLAVAIGCVQGIEIGATNTSLYHLPIVVRTILQSLNPLVMYIVCRIMGLEDGAQTSVGASVLFCSVGGLFLCHRGELAADGASAKTAFSNLNNTGVIFSFVAALCSCVRWALLQRLLHHADDHDGSQRMPRGEQQKQNPVEVLLFTAPVTGLMLSVGSILFEGSPAFFTFVFRCSLWIPMTAIGFSVMLVVLCELRLVQLTSALSLCIFGVIHNLVIIVSGVFIFGERLSELQVLGVAVGQFGCLLYSLAKAMHKRRRNAAGASTDEDTTKMAVSSDESRLEIAAIGVPATEVSHATRDYRHAFNQIDGNSGATSSCNRSQDGDGLRGDRKSSLPHFVIDVKSSNRFSTSNPPPPYDHAHVPGGGWRIEKASHKQEHNRDFINTQGKVKPGRCTTT